jgi:biopolymer transport protein ExbD
MNFRKKKRDEVHIDLTSLIDVVFMLLIFFMLATTFMRETRISLDLPEASGTVAKDEANMIEISIDAKGAYFVNAKPLINNQMETVKQALAKVAGQNVKQPILISGDAKAPHQAVVTAMDAAGQLGFTELRIAAAKETG